MTITDILGYLAAIGTTSSFLPQAYKVYKTKKTEDLSLGMFLFFCLGTMLWLIYGLLSRAYPVAIANLVTFILASYILYMKIRNMKTGN
ncbi:MAG: SemiSWEET transporter [Brevinematales bacterium]|jgi:MtN3 and saliva related transmembrane protein